MKKLLTIIAALALAAPVFAQAPQVDIICTDLGEGVVEVSYDASAAPVPVAGFAFNIEVGGDTITAIDSYAAQGATVPADSANVAAGYAIYMGSIDFGADPADIDAYGDPVAPAADPDALGGLGTNGITVELGALYEHGVDTPPAQSGVLFTITVEDTDASGDTIVAISEETTRGGIVLEGPAEATFFSEGCTVIWDGEPVCVKDTAPFFADWDRLGRPDCWCFQRNCRGDVDGLKQLNFFWVYSNDLNTFKQAFGKMEAQLATIPNGLCADFDRTKQLNFFWVYSNDLAIFKSYFGKMEAQVPVCDQTNYNFWTN